MKEHELIKQALIETLSNKEEYLDSYYMHIGYKSYTRRQLINHINDMDETGKDLIKGIYQLTLDLLNRRKLKL